ncbi:MAG: FUN14 domain-containing protein [Planctomycetota bacterium]
MSEIEQQHEVQRRGLTRGQVILLVVGVVCLVAGGALAFLAGDEPPAPRTLPTGANSLVEGGAAAPATVADDPLRPWSRFFLKSGGGFLIGFCVGFALRAFLKLSALVLGVILIAVFGLHAADIAVVDFAALEGLFDQLWRGGREHLSAGRAFLEGHLPSAAAAGVGALVGLRRG